MPSVCITLGTRPEAIKLAPVIRQFRQQSDFETHVILTGQHREMVDQVMRWFGLRADYDLAIMQPGQTLADITCRSLTGLERIYQELSPDIVLVQGDTTTAFAAALAAFYQQIPVGHVEAGLRTDNLMNPFPEEANRRLISQISQLHFAPTTQAIANLKKADILGGAYCTGNTVIDALLTVAESNPPCEIPDLDWHSKRVILATVHRRENWGEPLQDILQGFLQIVTAFPDVAILLPMHRNPKVRQPIQAILGDHPQIFLTEPLDYPQLVGAMQRCYLLLTDSGGLQEEAPSLGKPVLVLRETTERPEAVTAGTAKLIGTAQEDIFRVTQTLLTDPVTYDQMANAVNPFGDGTSSAQIFQIVREFLQAKAISAPGPGPN
ncbi:MAG: UDP-N-acetylglucosamine 2-epimerase (non-hydrolyzing) [Synechococcus sp.]|nr:UDP-N-acetylglucosamine 2-epimerase (non-hydrolyzing) [Synechococcus sp.]